MNTTILSRSLVLLLATGATLAASAADATPNALLERGRYLTHNVAGCGDCHTPRNERGQIVPGTEFMGSVLPFAPTVPMPVWAPAAPKIAGLDGYTTEQAVKFLMTGERPSGTPARPPMPEFRLNRADAEAVVAYLKSLK